MGGEQRDAGIAKWLGLICDWLGLTVVVFLLAGAGDRISQRPLSMRSILDSLRMTYTHFILLGS